MRAARKDRPMTNHLTRMFEMSFDDVVASTIRTLRHHGFSVLTRIDVRETLKSKLGADFRPYLILGACNPHLAYRALRAENKIGTMRPCNVVVQQQNGCVEVSAVDPVASMQAITNVELGQIAQEVRCALQRVVDEIGEPSTSS
jgi:uncharacterized protein (DUF302 family)